MRHTFYAIYKLCDYLLPKEFFTILIDVPPKQKGEQAYSLKF